MEQRLPEPGKKGGADRGRTVRYRMHLDRWNTMVGKNCLIITSRENFSPSSPFPVLRS